MIRNQPIRLWTSATVTLLLFLAALVLLPDCSNHHEKEGRASGQQLYTCPMHPQVMSDRPGVCPICHMELVKKVAENAPEDSLSARLNLSLRKQQLANVAVAPVQEKQLTKKVIAYSRLEIAESARKLVSARFNGRIEKVFADRVGIRVQQGQPLFEIYSPDLVQAQNDFLLAKQNAQLASRKSDAPQESNESRMLASAHEKLLLLGLTPAQITQLETEQNVLLTSTYYSPISGTILEKKVLEGMYVNEGSVLYDIADLSTLWNIAEVYEQDIAAVKKGQPALLQLDAFPGEVFSGVIDLIYPVIDAQTRAVKVRSVFKSMNRLAPNMYGQTTFTADLGAGVTAPREAVLLTGKRAVVWVQNDDGAFSAREVRVGARIDDDYQILSGLQAGERIAVSGGYLIDSESQLKSGEGGSSTQSGHTMSASPPPSKSAEQISSSQ
jgi:membrane fusion protein, copper/silver efflux system